IQPNLIAAKTNHTFVPYLKIPTMRILLTFIALMLFSLSFSQTNENAVIKTAIYCDHCKECETCGQKFATSMYKIKGVKMYDLDTEKNTITVYYNPKKTDLTSIKKGIGLMGYD